MKKNKEANDKLDEMLINFLHKKKCIVPLFVLLGIRFLE